MPVKAILFDMDGVLIDAREWHFRALNDALALFGLEIAADEHLATYDGLPTRSKLEILSRTRGLPKGLHGFINEWKQRRTLEITLASCRPLFMHKLALSRLKAEGLRLAVCSNSVRQTVDAMIGQAGLSEYLDFSLSNEDVLNPKPDPEIYSLAIERLGLCPEECLVVEDNENGVRAARESGAHVMVVGSVFDVSYERIKSTIGSLEGVK